MSLVSMLLDHVDREHFKELQKFMASTVLESSILSPTLVFQDSKWNSSGHFEELYTC